MVAAGQYDLLGELTSGGMATVFLGRRRSASLGKDLVAIKCMRPELAGDESFLALFLDEASLTLKIKHPNVVPTLEVVPADGRLLIVMRYVEGLSAAELFAIAQSKEVAIPPAIAVAIIVDALRGLHAAHELVDGHGRALSVVHRDVSPPNLLIGVDGIARVLDFGVAKAASQVHVTMQGEIKGKLAYMPPEQQLAETVDRRADVYAAGVVLWELLTGQRLFGEQREEDLVRHVFEGVIEPPSHRALVEIPPTLDRVVLRALARKREDRWWSADEMAKALSTAVPPARASDVARFLQDLASDELERRAAEIRALEASRFDATSSIDARVVIDALTATGRALPKPENIASAPTAAPAARPRGDRDARHARRRRQNLLIFGGLGLAILLLMIVAFMVGMGFPRP